MHAPPPRLRVAVDQESGDRIELPADVETQRPDRRLIADARADRAPQIVQVNVPAVRPHVAGVEEQHRAEAAADPRTPFEAVLEHAVAADREPRVAERADLVAAPASDARRAAEEKLHRE